MSFFRWRGNKVKKNIERATALAIDQTTASCVMHAKTNHPWGNRSHNLENSLQMRPAGHVGSGIQGEWGSYGLGAKAKGNQKSYAIHLEYGTKFMRAYPFLFPAADEEYPKLAKRIKEAM